MLATAFLVLSIIARRVFEGCVHKIPKPSGTVVNRLFSDHILTRGSGMRRNAEILQEAAMADLFNSQAVIAVSLVYRLAWTSVGCNDWIPLRRVQIRPSCGLSPGLPRLNGVKCGQSPSGGGNKLAWQRRLRVTQ